MFAYVCCCWGIDVAAICEASLRVILLMLHECSISFSLRKAGHCG